ncbi:putative DNA helicase ino80 [Cichlidogyrus casuarinus]|uniref:Chromatin-remodeling ATPase INO80 n=1 Tax=Cichlidogyrus casuarinus TaxID=1844966 RepID=A0ABD2PPB7_9PLAT
MECELTDRQRHMYQALCQKLPLGELKQLGSLTYPRSSDSQLMNLVMQLRKICNHPDLIEHREVSYSSHSFSLNPLQLNRYFTPSSPFSISPQSGFLLKDHFAQQIPSLICQITESRTLPFLDADLYRAFHNYAKRFNSMNCGFNSLGRLSKLAPGRGMSRHLHDLNCQWSNTFFSLDLPERNSWLSRPMPQCPSHALIFVPLGVHYFADWSMMTTRNCMPTQYPAFLADAYLDKVVARPLELFQSKPRSAQVQLSQAPVNIPWKQPIYLVPSSKRWTDSGKLVALSLLLQKLKAEGHRVLIYSQMTKMIDILEDVLHQKKHMYLRLDGSSKLSDRRDMVNQWQTNPRWFIFLLSTRAGGLGINLTAADTVIFFDSDWNPTVDQQAMDRAHRLGQTKPVTVYRLICRGTIEKRMLQRAQAKRNMQHLVIKDGSQSASQDPKESERGAMMLNNTANTDQPLSQSELASILLLTDDDNEIKSLKHCSSDNEDLYQPVPKVLRQ